MHIIERSRHVGPVIPTSATKYIVEGESTAGYTFTPVWDLLLVLESLRKESRFYVSFKVIYLKTAIRLG
jgi:hypothetical protein